MQLWLLVIRKALSPRGAKTGVHGLWRSLRQRSDWYFLLVHKQNSFSQVTVVTFVDGIHNSSRDLNIGLVFGLSMVSTQLFLLLSNFCLALQVMSIFSSEQLMLDDCEEPVASRNVLSLAEVLLMSVIDKWEGKRGSLRTALSVLYH